MSRELLQKAYVALDGQWWAKDLCRQIDEALAAPMPEPVALCDALRWSGAKESHGAMMFSPDQLRKFYEFASRAAPPAAPADMVMVPLKFVQGFHTLAHNYSLRAVPPIYYTGTEGDAFSAAYASCGQDLARLRAMIAAAPAPADVLNGHNWSKSESKSESAACAAVSV